MLVMIAPQSVITRKLPVCIKRKLPVCIKRKLPCLYKAQAPCLYKVQAPCLYKAQAPKCTSHISQMHVPCMISYRLLEWGSIRPNWSCTLLRKYTVRTLSNSRKPLTTSFTLHIVSQIIEGGEATRKTEMYLLQANCLIMEAHYGLPTDSLR
jgi:hypothetical protein